jgi:hypothetical protein
LRRRNIEKERVKVKKRYRERMREKEREREGEKKGREGEKEKKREKKSELVQRSKGPPGFGFVLQDVCILYQQLHLYILGYFGGSIITFCLLDGS